MNILTIAEELERIQSLPLEERAAALEDLEKQLREILADDPQE